MHKTWLSTEEGRHLNERMTNYNLPSSLYSNAAFSVAVYVVHPIYNGNPLDCFVFLHGTYCPLTYLILYYPAPLTLTLAIACQLQRAST